MREAVSRGFFLSSTAPFGYKRVKVNDGSKERPTLVPDPECRSHRAGGVRELTKGQRT